MLLYNDKYEFLGISEEGLRLLNYGSMEELLQVCSDVADLFANEPGYIHNFKNFKWIDFLLHADSDASSAIVHGKGRTFSCQLSITPFYLSSEPVKPGYSVEMLHVKHLSGEDYKPQISTPKPVVEPVFTPPPTEVREITTPLPDHTHLTPTQLSEPSVFDIPEVEPSSLDDLIDLVPPSKPAVQETKIGTPSIETTEYTASEQAYLSHLKVDRNYRFDPQIAADELGLPVDLIQEFIGDFIQQAYAFKEELYAAAIKGDFNNLHILSHKLKGVAANLRVENALETLTIINASTDIPEIEAHLKYFYTIIAKLDGKEPIIDTIKIPEQVPDIPVSEPLPEKQPEDIYTFDIKLHDDEPLMVQDTFDLGETADASGQNDFKKEYLTPDLSDPLEEKIPEELLSTLELPEVSEDAFSLDDVIKPDPEPINAEELISDENVTLHYDADAMAGTLGIEPAFLHELLSEFKQDAGRINESILTAIGAFDTHTWREHASRFIGISDNLRLNEISEEFSIIASTNDAQKAKQASLRLANYLDQLQ